MSCSEDEFYIRVLKPSVPSSSCRKDTWGGFAIPCQVGQQDQQQWGAELLSSAGAAERLGWEDPTGKGWLLGGFIPHGDGDFSVTDRGLHLQRGWQTLWVPSLQPTSCVETADSSAEEFGHWGPIS